MQNRNGSGGQRPSVPAAELLNATRRDLRLLASNSKGKLTYLPSLDYIFKEIYGIKHIASRLISKKNSEVFKVYTKIQMDTLMYILLDSEVHDIIRQAALLYHKLEKDASLTSKEVKKYEKKIRSMCDVIRKDFNIKKQKNEDDIDFKQISSFIDRRSDDYGYYFDDDDDSIYGYGFYDDDDDRVSSDVISKAFGSSRRRKSQPNSALAKVVDKYESRRRPKEMDDDEENTWDEYDEIRGIRDNDDDDEDDQDYLAEILTNFSNRLNGVESLIRDLKKPDIYPLPEESSVKSAPVPDDPQTVSKVLKDVSGIVRQNSADLKILNTRTAQALSNLSGKINRMDGTLNNTVNHVNQLIDAYDEIVNILDEDDEDDSIATVSGQPGMDTVSMEDVMTAFGQTDPIDDASSSPVNVRTLDTDNTSV